MIIAETPRLKIRELNRGDTPALSKLLGDPSVMEFSANGTLTESETVNFIQWCSSSYQTHGYGLWALINNASSRLIGFCGLSKTSIDGTDEVEVAYRLAKEQWGEGLATEAVNRVLSYGFLTCNLASIVGIVSPRHTASIRVLEKVGFKSFHETRYRGWDVRVYRLSKHDWNSL